MLKIACLINLSFLGLLCLAITAASERKPTTRKLLFSDSMILDLFLARADPVAPTSSPLSGGPSPLPFSLPLAPKLPPSLGTARPPQGLGLPRCKPPAKSGLWCVAKPSVPTATLQEAMDYACEAGDCEEIKPHGNCFSPGNVVAHSSYAFNSYWQKNKRNGGSCSFGGTAMLVDSDPSFGHCRFILS
ncbi:major pollen allergen Ole e 10-like [Diospyros lotus]|uniref:major pollen allergen Ole e 10-like n=1 Tax=Diospyros lotus TaxID=55363 RepID=UPI00224CA63A|nr:major pollen allergen Ole e 10-like [Diospyros lotus]